MFDSVRCVQAVFVLCVHQTLGFHLGVSLFPCTLYTLHEKNSAPQPTLGYPNLTRAARQKFFKAPTLTGRNFAAN